LIVYFYESKVVSISVEQKLKLALVGEAHLVKSCTTLGSPLVLELATILIGIKCVRRFTFIQKSILRYKLIES